MEGAVCEYPGCGQQAVRRCDRCRRTFCDRHIEPLYPDVGARSPFRCTLCTKESRQEIRQHTRRSRRGLIPALVILLIGIATIIIGTALAPASDSVTTAATAGLILAGIGAVSLAYSFFS